MQVRGVKITNPPECVNTDGIDIDCCRFATVSDCIITTGDDAIAIRCDSKRLKNPKPCENITVTNCILSSNSSVFRIGVGGGEIRHVTVSNLVVSGGGDLITYSTSFMGRGKAIIQDMIFSDISAYNVRHIIDCIIEKGSVKNTVMKNLNINATGGICIVQNGKGAISGLTLKDINIEVKEKKIPGEKYLLNISNTNNTTLDGVRVSCKSDAWEKILYSQGNIGLTDKDCSF